ncbi:MAG: glycosyltransferase family 1 protein [Capnocytophaga sp.]|nr:glycosyltransferase family 1 protein [Capnocytophaga sp.]
MKIGFDAKRAFHNFRGLGNYSRDLIRILQERSQNELILFNPKKRNNTSVAFNKYTREVCPTSFLGKKLRGLWRLFSISKLAQREKLDLYHGLSGEIPIGIYKHTTTIVTIHDLIFLRFPSLYSYFDRVIHTKKFQYAAKKSHHIIAISEQTKQDIMHYFQIPSEKISVVYQGCHQAFKKQYSEEEKTKVKQKYNLPNQFILNVGAIEERKNVLEIVKAIKNIDIPLILVGKKTKYYFLIENFCKTNKMEGKVKVLSGVSMEELAIIYQLSTIFCYPSVFEGFGIPIIEALFSKVPVITSQGSCFQEAGGENSIYINPKVNTAEQIQKNIEKLLKNPFLREEMVEKGYTFVQKFTDDMVFHHLNEVYKRVLAEKNK